MKRLAILLATYNSGQRLRLLLNSLLSQDYQNWKLYIHDDLSTDETIAIIREYSTKFPNKIQIMTDCISKSRGAKNSFLWLLENVDADYYMFCDHDDIWLPNKINLSINKIFDLELKYPYLPICVYTDLAIVDKDYNILHHSMWKQAKINPNILEKKEYLKVFNCVTGCTMLFNHKARDIVFPYPDDVPMHDWWIAYKINQEKGILSHINKSTILYCQHESNVVGAKNINFSYIFHKIKNINTTIRLNNEKIHFIKKFEKYSSFKYYWYKSIYSLYRLFI